MAYNHTPGPWSVEAGPATSSGLAVLSPAGRIVAVCKHLPAPDMIGSECEANAPLVAAAPAMLAALQEAVARVQLANAEGDSILSAWLPDALAAIAAATGER